MSDSFVTAHSLDFQYISLPIANVHCSSSNEDDWNIATLLDSFIVEFEFTGILGHLMNDDTTANQQRVWDAFDLIWNGLFITRYTLHHIGTCHLHPSLINNLLQIFCFINYYLSNVASCVLLYYACLYFAMYILVHPQFCQVFISFVLPIIIFQASTPRCWFVKCMRVQCLYNVKAYAIQSINVFAISGLSINDYPPSITGQIWQFVGSLGFIVICVRVSEFWQS